MRSLIALTAAAPLALLAACGESTPVDQVEAEPMNTDLTAITEPEPAPDTMPEVPPNALDSLDYAGTYSRNDEGQTSSITLRVDNTYDYTAPDGTMDSGTYTRLDDGSRIRIADFDGGPGYFAVADGAIYRLPGAESSTDDIALDTMYRRETGLVLDEDDEDDEDETPTASERALEIDSERLNGAALDGSGASGPDSGPQASSRAGQGANRASGLNSGSGAAQPDNAGS